MAKGQDIGTGFLVAASQDNNQQIQIKSIRDCFLDFENDISVKSLLSMNKMNFIEEGDKLYLVGTEAMSMANIFKRNVRRPLSQGVIAPGELDAEKVLLVLLGNILGKATTPSEVCFYSVPGVPLGQDAGAVTYHQAMFGKLISSLGYGKVVAMNESAAIVYSNCAKEMFSGLAISFGAGMVNVALLYQTMVGMSFSIIGSGDWIDEMAAKAVGTSATRICAIKERGVNLLDPTEGDPKFLREREAIVIYYKSLILHVLDAIKTEFLKRKSSIDLPASIPLVISGGTSLPKGFKELFDAGFQTIKDFPIPISETKLASDQLNAVAQGLLVAALNYNEATTKK